MGARSFADSDVERGDRLTGTGSGVFATVGTVGTMTPRVGGEADKFGNRYEGAWITRQILAIVAGRAASIQLEPFGDLGEGIEFSLDRGGPPEVHQVKRQPGQLASWTLKRLESEGVLEVAARHADAGRTFHFVSTVPARDLDELGDRARRSDDFRTFVEGQLTGKRLEALFTQLTESWEDPRRAWERLRATFVLWPDERDIRAVNEALAAAYSAVRRLQRQLLYWVTWSYSGLG